MVTRDQSRVFRAHWTEQNPPVVFAKTQTAPNASKDLCDAEFRVLMEDGTRAPPGVVELQERKRFQAIQRAMDYQRWSLFFAVCAPRLDEQLHQLESVCKRIESLNQASSSILEPSSSNRDRGRGEETGVGECPLTSTEVRREMALAVRLSKKMDKERDKLIECYAQRTGCFAAPQRIRAPRAPSVSVLPAMDENRRPRGSACAGPAINIVQPAGFSDACVAETAVSIADAKTDPFWEGNYSLVSRLLQRWYQRKRECMEKISSLGTRVREHQVQ